MRSILTSARLDELRRHVAWAKNKNDVQPLAAALRDITNAKKDVSRDDPLLPQVSELETEVQAQLNACHDEIIGPFLDRVAERLRTARHHIEMEEPWIARNHLENNLMKHDMRSLDELDFYQQRAVVRLRHMKYCDYMAQLHSQVSALKAEIGKVEVRLGEKYRVPANAIYTRMLANISNKNTRAASKEYLELISYSHYQMGLAAMLGSAEKRDEALRTAAQAIDKLPAQPIKVKERTGRRERVRY